MFISDFPSFRELHFHFVCEIVTIIWLKIGTWNTELECIFLCFWRFWYSIIIFNIYRTFIQHIFYILRQLDYHSKMQFVSGRQVLVQELQPINSINNMHIWLSRTLCDFLFYKLYVNIFRHNYGKVGSAKSYDPYSCLKIINHIPSAGDHCGIVIMLYNVILKSF